MAAPQPKVSDLIRAEDPTKVYVSFEFFPPKTEKGDESLHHHVEEFAKQQPVFIDFTWGAGGSTSEKTTALCKKYKDDFGLVVNMHLTCTNMEEGKVKAALSFCKDNGITNLVTLRGDPPAGQEWKASAEGYTCARDLVQHVREFHGDYFCCAVAGYPEGHPDKIHCETGVCSDEQMDAEIAYLKSKIEAGGDLIITQLFYDTSKFLVWQKKVREAGITVPILPGMLPMVSYAGLQRMVQLCKTYLPEDVKIATERLKDDEEGFKEFGVQLTTQMCKELMAAGVNHFHFYTLNNTYSTFKVLKNLGLYKE